MQSTSDLISASTAFRRTRQIASITFAILAARTVAAPPDTLVGIVPDDAFYYLQVAKHIAAGAASTADLVSRTNGYHPLWMLVAVLLARLSTGWTLVRLLVAASFCFHAATAFGVRRLVRRLGSTAIADLAAACWLLNPLTFAIATQGVEASIYTFAATLALNQHLDMAEALKRRAALPAWQYGVAMGLLCLARTEAILPAALAVTWLALKVRHRADARSVILRTSAAAVCIVAPWITYSLTEVGTLVPDSGAMKAVWTSGLFPSLASRTRNIVDTIDFFGRTGPRTALGWHVPTWMLLAVYAFGVFGTWRLLARSTHAIRRVLVAATTASCGAIFLVYALTLSDRQLWWLALPTLGTFLIVAALATEFANGPSLARLVPGAGIVAIALFAIVTMARGTQPLYPWQLDVYRSEQDVQARVPPGERIGYFNAGIPMYFGTGREVALEGIVSHDALRAWQARRFDDYLTEAHVRYIADDQRALNRAMEFSQLRPGVTVLAEYPLRGWPLPHRFLWKVVAPDSQGDAPR